MAATSTSSIDRPRVHRAPSVGGNPRRAQSRDGVFVSPREKVEIDHSETAKHLRRAYALLAELRQAIRAED